MNDFFKNQKLKPINNEKLYHIIHNLSTFGKLEREKSLLPSYLHTNDKQYKKETQIFSCINVHSFSLEQ